MKKTIIFLLAIVFSTNILLAQKSDWKEMHAFHKVMGAVFHPAEEGNLKPLKAESALLVKEAQKWQKSLVPSGYDARIVKPILSKLVAKTKEVNKAVREKRSTETLTKMITETHDVFHEIMEKCKH